MYTVVREKNTEHMRTTSIAVSVIIASHRPNLVTGLLQSLSQQSIGAEEYEVIVVSDYQNSSLNLQFPLVNFYYLPDKSISRKRNAGVAVSKGDILAFIDDDCIAGSDWILSGIKYLTEHPHTAAVEGQTIIERSTEHTGAYREYRRLEKPGFRTNNVFYRKSVFLEVGGFDERFTVQREDIDLAFSVMERGYKIDYEQTIRVEHRFRHWENWDLLKNCRNRFFDPLLYKKHPENYRVHIKTPCPPSQIILLIVYLLSLLNINTRSHFKWFSLVATVAITGVSIRRVGGRFSFHQLFTTIVEVTISPLVLLGALLYGSIRFRKLLLW